MDGQCVSGTSSAPIPVMHSTCDALHLCRPALTGRVPGEGQSDTFFPHDSEL